MQPQYGKDPSKKGLESTQSNTLANTQYSFKSVLRMEGTNPEELIAAAHSGCFAMQLSALLEKVLLLKV
jgi:osmotically inducible protein OsmC